MNPGRELDALIAEKVMGLNLVEKIDECHTFIANLPYYSTDIKAAWEVIEHFANDTGARLELRALLEPDCVGYRAFECAFTGNNFGEPIVGKTAPHAICLAALKACRVEA